jgi:hypothetical protein
MLLPSKFRDKLISQFCCCPKVFSIATNPLSVAVMYRMRLFSVFLKTVNTRLHSTINRAIRGMLLFVLDLQQLAGGKIARKPPETNAKYQAQYSQVKLIEGSPSPVTAWCGGTACWSSVSVDIE